MKIEYFLILLLYDQIYARPQPEKLIKIAQFCIDERDQYLIRCPTTSLREMPDLDPTNIKFCTNYERLCPRDTGQSILTDQNEAIPIKAIPDGPHAPLIAPPDISQDEVARDPPDPTTTTPRPATKITEIPVVIADHGASLVGILPKVNPANQPLTDDIIKTCTPDCTAPQCTKPCKCANTHIAVDAKCNPPSSSDMVGVCQAWYAECPMFKQLQYGEHS